jgi:hypothetical protein
LSVTVHTSEFEISHGRKPRGNGCWVFYFFQRRADYRGLFVFYGSFSEAKKAAVAEARRRRNIDEIYVGAQGEKEATDDHRLRIRPRFVN